MNPGKFVITPFENRSGLKSWRVEGRLNGDRIRRNFLTREEAAAERATLEIKALQTSSGLRSIATPLTDAQVREAEALFQRVQGKPRPLSFYVDYALANYREPDQQRPLSDAIAEYLAAKGSEVEQEHLSYPQYRKISIDLKRIERHFPEKTVAEMTSAILLAYLEARRLSLKTFNNQRGTLGTFFKFCFHRGWVVENPVLKVPSFRVRQRRGVAVTLSAVQVQELMQALETMEEGRFVPYFALCLFAGIRPGVPYGEISKLQPADVNLEAGLIHIRPEVSKVREPRRIAIQPNLAAWLRAYPLSRYPIVIGDFQKRRAKFKDRFKLTHDVLRHTYISMFVAKYRSIGEAAIQAGNSESIIRRHYLDLKTAAEGEQFFNILPQIKAPANVSPSKNQAVDTQKVA